MVLVCCAAVLVCSCAFSLFFLILPFYAKMFSQIALSNLVSRCMCSSVTISPSYFCIIIRILVPLLFTSDSRSSSGSDLVCTGVHRDTHTTWIYWDPQPSRNSHGAGRTLVKPGEAGSVQPSAGRLSAHLSFFPSFGTRRSLSIVVITRYLLLILFLGSH